MIRRGGPIKRSRLKTRGPKAEAWKAFRDAKAKRDRDEEGFIKCQDWKIGLKPCRRWRQSPDLHHIINRDARPDLYFDETNLIWLVRECHDEAHNKDTDSSSSKTENDPSGPLEEAASDYTILGLQRRAAEGAQRDPGAEVYSEILGANARLLEHQKESGDGGEASPAEARR